MNDGDNNDSLISFLYHLQQQLLQGIKNAVKDVNEMRPVGGRESGFSLLVLNYTISAEKKK